MDIDYATIGGTLCGALAGGGARYGRLCSMSAIEDALIGGDYRGAKAWGLAVAVAGLATMGLVALGLVSLDTSSMLDPRLHVLGALLGGCLFGLGMTLVGTCSFGLLVRAGGGDLRALICVMIVGVFAYAVTTGLLAAARDLLLGVGVLDLSTFGAASVDRVLAPITGEVGAQLIVAGGLALLAMIALADERVLMRPRLIASAIAIGIAVAGGWLATSQAVESMTATHVESLSFVAPTGRALLQFMAVPFRGVNFGVAAIIGALLASFFVALAKGEIRWEAFDDAREMRRHLAGAALMGVGGVLAHGCTVGQGLTAASALALSAPLFVAGTLFGAQAGLKFLIEGTSLWRMGFSPRAD
ncbi:MAG: YeeE/YedE thiosulfate transporter family protein [Hyphomicrobiaceae bacterium]